jgi:dTDP-4-dehydrorhamnose 3,5-epimerase
MVVEETNLEGCYVITPNVYEDSRGKFFESFNNRRFEELTGINTTFVQDNQSVSKKGVIRGLHFQTGDFEQAKLVRVVEGKVLDISVDLRQGSDTYGEHFSKVLDSSKNEQIFIPKGFAHGFLTLSKTAIFCYKCDNYYNTEFERGIKYDDKTLNIDWGISKSKIIISNKDQKLPAFENLLK